MLTFTIRQDQAADLALDGVQVRINGVPRILRAMDGVVMWTKEGSIQRRGVLLVQEGDIGGVPALTFTCE